MQGSTKIWRDQFKQLWINSNVHRTTGANSNIHGSTQIFGKWVQTFEVDSKHLKDTKPIHGLIQTSGVQLNHFGSIQTFSGSVQTRGGQLKHSEVNSQIQGSTQSLNHPDVTSHKHIQEWAAPQWTNWQGVCGHNGVQLTPLGCLWEQYCGRTDTLRGCPSVHNKP